MHRYPVYKPCLNGNEKKYVIDCIDSTWISSKGKYVNLFEDKFAKYLGVEHATGVCNGTVALHLALIALGIGPDDEVIVPTLTYIASVNAITYTGAKPIFVDSSPNSWQMDPEDIRRKISSKTKAVVVVHLYGHPCEMDTIMKIADENGVFIVEDAAEALGARYRDRKIGTFGDVATFSFYGNKTITTGEGGMVVTNDKNLYERIVHFKGQGLVKEKEYWHDVVGYNYRMTNICAAIGLAQLERISEIIQQKIRIADYYKSALDSIKVDYHKSIGNVFHSYWIFSILIRDPSKRDNLRDCLDRSGIETRPVFYPVHTMPMYTQSDSIHSVAEDIGSRGVNLPSYPDLSKDDIDYICNVIAQWVTRQK